MRTSNVLDLTREETNGRSSLESESIEISDMPRDLSLGVMSLCFARVLVDQGKVLRVTVPVVV